MSRRFHDPFLFVFSCFYIPQGSFSDFCFLNRHVFFFLFTEFAISLLIPGFQNLAILAFHFLKNMILNSNRLLLKDSNILNIDLPQTTTPNVLSTVPPNIAITSFSLFRSYSWGSELSSPITIFKLIQFWSLPKMLLHWNFDHLAQLVPQ